MAATTALQEEGKWGDKRVKIYTVTLDGSDTSIDIKPGLGYSDPVGAYSYYTLSSGTYTFTILAGTTGHYTHIVFFNNGSGV